MPSLRSIAGVAGFALACVSWAGCSSGKKSLEVFCADSLAASFQEIKGEFERLHPNVDVRLNIHGSVMITRLIADRDADVVALADHRLVEKILAPQQADWVAKFLSTEIVLAASTASKRRTEITPDNWFDILLSPGIRYGYANPTQDSCGTYTRLAWLLAERHYFTSRGKQRPLVQELLDACPKENVALDANHLIADLLNPGRVDYAFVYRVHAIDQKLTFTPLPKEINLGDPSLAREYAKVEVPVTDFHGGTETVQGTYIAFGITIPRKSRNPQAAQEFIRFVLSTAGQDIVRRSGFRPISPARVPAWGALPDFLAGIATAEK